MFKNFYQEKKNGLFIKDFLILTKGTFYNNQKINFLFKKFYKQLEGQQNLIRQNIMSA